MANIPGNLPEHEDPEIAKQTRNTIFEIFVPSMMENTDDKQRTFEYLLAMVSNHSNLEVDYSRLPENTLEWRDGEIYSIMMTFDYDACTKMFFFSEQDTLVTEEGQIDPDNIDNPILRNLLYYVADPKKLERIDPLDRLFE